MSLTRTVNIISKLMGSVKSQSYVTINVKINDILAMLNVYNYCFI